MTVCSVRAPHNANVSNAIQTLIVHPTMNIDTSYLLRMGSGGGRSPEPVSIRNGALGGIRTTIQLIPLTAKGASQ